MVEEKDGARIKKNAPVLNDSQELLNEFRVRAMNNWCISHTWSHCTDSSWPKLYAHKHAVCKSGTSLCHGHWANVEFIMANTKHSKRSTRILNIWNEKKREEKLRSDGKRKRERKIVLKINEKCFEASFVQIVMNEPLLLMDDNAAKRLELQQHWMLARLAALIKCA